MKPLMTRRSIFIMAVILAVLFGFDAYLFVNKADADDNTENLQKFVQIQKEGIALREKLGENSAYAQIYVSSEVNKLDGTSDEEAVSKAIREYTENQALLKLAEKKGISCSAADVNEYMKELITEAESC